MRKRATAQTASATLTQRSPSPATEPLEAQDEGEQRCREAAHLKAKEVKEESLKESLFESLF